MSEYLIREAFQMFYLTYRDHHTMTPEQESAAQWKAFARNADIRRSIMLPAAIETVRAARGLSLLNGLTLAVQNL